jgi:hypothetical protein
MPAVETETAHDSVEALAVEAADRLHVTAHRHIERSFVYRDGEQRAEHERVGRISTVDRRFRRDRDRVDGSRAQPRMRKQAPVRRVREDRVVVGESDLGQAPANVIAPIDGAWPFGRRPRPVDDPDVAQRPTVVVEQALGEQLDSPAQRVGRSLEQLRSK